jgi:cytochrome P450
MGHPVSGTIVRRLNLVGWPPDTRPLFHATVSYPAESPEHARAFAAVPDLIGELLEFARSRRADPKDDLTSTLMRIEHDGQPLTDAHIVNLMRNLVAGGLDTSASVTAYSLRYLTVHRDLRQRLIDHPGLMRTAVEEFLRYFSVARSLVRTVTRSRGPVPRSGRPHGDHHHAGHFHAR